MNHLSKEQSTSNRLTTSNIRSGQRLSQPLGPISEPRKTTYTIEELIEISNKLHKEGKLAHAESGFRKVLEHIPNHPIALHFLGVIAGEAGNSIAAIQLIKRALKIAPNYGQAYNNLGNTYGGLGQIEEAIDNYSKALELNPDHVDAMFNLALMQRRLRNYEEAKILLQKCIEMEPRRADVHFYLGGTYEKLGDRMQAQICYRVALDIDPDYNEARVSLGNLFQTVGRLEESIEQYDLAMEKDPNYAKALTAKGVALRKEGKFSSSLDNILKSENIDPHNLSTLISLGTAYKAMGDNEKATEVYWRAFKVNPNLSATNKCLLYIALNNPLLTSREIYNHHLEVRGHFNIPELSKKSFPERDKTTSRRLKVGYISSDFRTHVVALNLLPVIANHDHDEFEIFLYSHVEFPDELTEVFKDCADHWRSIFHKSDQEAAELIEEDGIDVLVTLAGRFDENRPTIAANRPAPIQVSFHDCATSGLEAMDYYLTDNILHPADTPELFTEELYRLPYYYQYPIQEHLPEVKPSPFLSNGFITFGCFNKPEKINDKVIELWSDVLRAVPESKLLLKYFNYYCEPSMNARWKSRFKKNGISEDRLIFQFNSDSRQTHLALYQQIDISLDPFPFNGATTTFESLSMGVPVVSLLGKHFVDRVAASIVTHAGYPEFVAKTKQDYVELAKNLASDIDNLNKLRLSIRDNLHTSKICNGGPYCRNIETAFRDMWTTWCETGGYKSH
jgi:predicted O-linked N-acetylglucosamine transferase (SPINDLY family)